MDSKNIYISYEHYTHTIQWERQGDSEWVYIGTEGEVQKEKASELIHSFFKEKELYLITDRRNSTLIKKSAAISSILEVIEEFNPALANLSFSKVMEFNVNSGIGSY